MSDHPEPQRPPGAAHLSEDVLAKLSKPTMPLIEAGRLLFGLSRNATYAAAESGDIPSIRIGRKIVCPTGPLRRMIGLDGPEGRRPNGLTQPKQVAA